MGGGGFGNTDPSAMFDRLAKGNPTIAISSLNWYRSTAEQYAKEKGISNGQLTRTQWIEMSEQFNAKAAAAFGGGGGGKGGGGPGKKGADTILMPGGGGGPIQLNQPANLDFINQMADDAFKRYDANGDGKLNQDEMPEKLKSSLAKWDRNNDTFIDRDEYREFFRAEFLNRMGGGGPAGNDASKAIASIFIEEEELDKKTLVYRGGKDGKLPPGLPAWFKELDDSGDKDGQVAMWEWRKFGKQELNEFLKWDLNDDGYITAEEALKVLGISGTPTVRASSQDEKQGGWQGFKGGKGGKGGGKGGKGGGGPFGGYGGGG
jgi:Ca2+-binding EF-hand superfamily protein